MRALFWVLVKKSSREDLQEMHEVGDLRVAVLTKRLKVLFCYLVGGALIIPLFFSEASGAKGIITLLSWSGMFLLLRYFGLSDLGAYTERGRFVVGEIYKFWEPGGGPFVWNVLFRFKTSCNEEMSSMCSMGASQYPAMRSAKLPKSMLVLYDQENPKCCRLCIPAKFEKTCFSKAKLKAVLAADQDDGETYV